MTLTKKINKAIQYHLDGDWEKAEELYDDLLKTSPGHMDLLHMRGILARQKGNCRMAERFILDAIKSSPENAEFYCSLADVYKDLGRLQDAITWNGKAVEVNPNHGEAYIRLAEVYHDLGDLNHTVIHYEKGLALKANDDKSCFNLGVALQKQGEFDKAIKWYQRAIELNPEYTDAYNNMGNSYHARKRYHDALKSYRNALKIDPNHYRAMNNMGKTYQDGGSLNQALSCYDQAIELFPGYAETRFNRSIALLLNGNLKKGFKEYEWRFQRSKSESIYPYHLNVPRWEGLTFKGKTLFIHSEQGLGDTIQFIRYLPLIKSMGGQVIFETLRPLKGVLQNWSCIDVLTELEPMRKSHITYDYHIPLMSIPAIFETTMETIPGEVPYLYADPRKVHSWKSRMDDHRFKIGLVWAGKLSHEDDHNRSCSLKHFIPLIKRPDVVVYGLQKESVNKWTEPLPDHIQIHNIGEAFEDFSDTAGAIHHLDLIITVDTAAAHLAGAMGKKVWTLLSFMPDWRWLLDRTDTPWYPTMKLFRQSKRGDWESVMEKVIKELDTLLDRKSLNHTHRSEAESNFDDGIKSYEAALNLNPELPEVHYNMGNAWMDSGNTDEAISAYQKAVEMNPLYFQAYFNMGKAYQDRENEDQAVKAYQKAIEINPKMFEPYYNMGVIFQNQNMPDLAVKYYKQALKIIPHFSAAHNNLGIVLQEQNRFEEAIKCYQNAIRHDPAYADGYYNLGKIYQDFHRFEKAISEYRKALDANPSHHKALCNMGRAFHNLAMFDDAVSCYEKALDLKSDYVEAHFNLSLTRLITGNFKEGWREFEWRLKRKEWEKAYPHRHHVPQWDGSEFKGKTLLVHCEQGIGDSLNFVRYLPMVKERGGQVIFESRKSLIDLLNGFPGIDRLAELSPSQKTNMAYDMFIPIMSLPGLFETDIKTIPSKVPYIKANPDKINHWKDRIKSDGLKVGVVWAGSGVYPSRACPLNHLSMLSQVQGIHVYGLQKGPPSLQLKDDRIPRGLITENFGEDFKDFNDTAAVIHHMDLIISVDTSVAHLAGAMGKPVWLMLPFVGDWRWLFHTDKSPWYPGMRLFRQKTPGDWESVCAKMARELENRVTHPGRFKTREPFFNLSSPNKGRGQKKKNHQMKEITENKDHAETYYLSSMESYQKGEFNKALSLVNQAIKQDSKIPGNYYQKSLILLALNHKTEAAASLNTAISLNPHFAEAHFNLGLIYKGQHRFDESMKSFKDSLKYDPNNADAHYNIGNILKQQNKLQESIEYYHQSIALRPAFPKALNNLGLCYRELGFLDEAIEKYTLARQYRPDFAEAYWNRSIARLLKGDFKQGWKDFEWRFKRGHKNSIYPFKNRMPRWDGGKFKGKRLYVHSEQGLGDTIQFIRYLPMVKEKGGTVLFETMEELYSIMKGFPGVDELVLMSKDRRQAETCDFYIPILSLPMLFETDIDTIPNEIPYVFADPVKVGSWKKRINGNGFSIGLVWAGKPEHGNDLNRSCALEYFKNLTQLSGVDLFGLQKGEAGVKNGARLRQMGIHQLGGDIIDFADTAAAIAHLNLVISVDTSVAHLAGAMGKPVWTLIPHAPDWRWLLKREDTPWYPTMTLFRQPEPGDWESVFRKLTAKLQRHLKISA